MSISRQTDEWAIREGSMLAWQKKGSAPPKVNNRKERKKQISSNV